MKFPPTPLLAPLASPEPDLSDAGGSENELPHEYQPKVPNHHHRKQGNITCSVPNYSCSEEDFVRSRRVTFSSDPRVFSTYLSSPHPSEDNGEDSESLEYLSLASPPPSTTWNKKYRISATNRGRESLVQQDSYEFKKDVSNTNERTANYYMYTTGEFSPRQHLNLSPSLEEPFYEWQQPTLLEATMGDSGFASFSLDSQSEWFDNRVSFPDGNERSPCFNDAQNKSFSPLFVLVPSLEQPSHNYDINHSQQDSSLLKLSSHKQFGAKLPADDVIDGFNTSYTGLSLPVSPGGDSSPLINKHRSKRDTPLRSAVPSFERTPPSQYTAGQYPSFSSLLSDQGVVINCAETRYSTDFDMNGDEAFQQRATSVNQLKERMRATNGHVPRAVDGESGIQSSISQRRANEAFVATEDSLVKPSKAIRHFEISSPEIPKETRDSISHVPPLPPFAKVKPSKTSSDAPPRPLSSSSPPLDASDNEISLCDDNYVGFCNLPNQIYRKAVQKGFEFNLMVVGQSGLGKSTFINSLFLADIYGADYPGPSLRIGKTLQVQSTSLLLIENGVRLNLTITDTPGFGDQVNNKDWCVTETSSWDAVSDYVDKQFEKFLNAESQVTRTNVRDTRVHACLYFIPPTGHCLRPIDIEFMKKLQDKMNIIPLIAKADTLTPSETKAFKQRILDDLKKNEVKIYQFPEESEEEEEDSKDNSSHKWSIPFAVCGSLDSIMRNGKMVRVRQYPWGTVEIDNAHHCDFVSLRSALIRAHMQELREVTARGRYEPYRSLKLSTASGGGADKGKASASKNPLTVLQDERQAMAQKMQALHADMQSVFEKKVREKEVSLAEKEKQMETKHREMMLNVRDRQNDLDEQRRQFEKERAAWEEAQNQQALEISSNPQGNAGRNNEKKKEKKGRLF